MGIVEKSTDEKSAVVTKSTVVNAARPASSAQDGRLKSKALKKAA